MATMLERIQGILCGDVPPPPVARLVGFTLVSVARGASVFEMEAGPQHANPMGTLHASRGREKEGDEQHAQKRFELTYDRAVG
jgi:hypothetical protein